MVFETLLDKDGLLATAHVRAEGEHFKLVTDGSPLFIEPTVRSVVAILQENPDIWSQSRLHFTREHIGKKGVPIFGVPFDAALKLIVENHQRLIKSLFQLIPNHQYSGRGLEAALLVHVARKDSTEEDKPNITLEAWQLVEGVSETFYCHGLLTKNVDHFTHLDGATMQHTEQEKLELFQKGSKVKGLQYRKHFRVDGEIPLDFAMRVLTAYLPTERLSLEYFVAQHEENIV